MNSRNQVLDLKMGNSPTNGGLMHLTYEYGEFDNGGNVDVTKNAGNIAKQTITFNGLANPFVQSYKYDSLDRITEAKETVNGGQTWIQTFGYDRYGNRTSHAETVGSQAKTINEVTLPAVDASTNKFSNTTDYEFDAVGNLIRDIHGRQFTFNGDNKQVEVRNSTNQVVGEYKYDGLGKRIKKETATEYIVFVYDGLGKLIGEYSADGPPAAPTVNYTATDPLGSPRVLTNKQGEVVSRRDFMPFGEEIVAMAETHRTPGDKYGVGDGVRQKFTGYERDEETGLDFAEARYYYNNHGRFTAVDPLLASGKSANPQTFNRYAYTMNRPLILTDPTGLQAGSRETQFALEHPAAAAAIGPRATKYGENIASNATRFATNSDFRNARGLSEVTEINALRHAILAAAITVRFGGDVAKKATDAHEEDAELPSAKQNGEMTFSSERDADKEADLRNNQIGIQIGASLPSDSTMKDVSKAVLDHFKEKGLHVLKKEKNGKISVIKTTIGNEQYQNTLKEWNRRDDGTGFTPEGKKEHLREMEQQRQNRGRVYE